MVGSVFVKFYFETSGRCVRSISEKPIVGMFDVLRTIDIFMRRRVVFFLFLGSEYICKM